jgi:hypothetical protein
MRKLALLAGVALVLCLGSRSVCAAPAQGPFADVPTDHWAYDAVNELAALGIFNGYPDQTFGGKRALTRYEFAVALQRMLQDVQRRIDAKGGPTTPGGPGAPGQRGAPGPQGPPGVPPEELARMRTAIETLQRLAREFADTLAQLGTDVDQLKRDLAALQARVGKVEEAIAKMPKITGTATTSFIGRTSKDFEKFPANATFQPTDIDGRPLPRSDNVLEGLNAIYDVDIGITARLSDVATAKVLLNAGNYLQGYLNNSISTVKPVGSTSFDQVTAYYAYLEAPIRFGGLGANITVGKFGQQFTPYTLKLLDVDSYTSNDKTDSGDYPILGARLNFKMGNFNFQTYAGKSEEIDYADLTSTGGSRLPPTFLGGGPLFIGNPHRLLIAPPSAAGVLDQSFGARVSYSSAFSVLSNAFQVTSAGATYIQAAGSIDSDRFRELEVYGGNLGLKLFNLINLEAEYDQSEWKNRFGQRTSDSGSDANEVWDVRWNLGLGKLLGLSGKWRDLYIRSFYKKIGLNFDAPGNWGSIGRWKNPRGIEGTGFVLSFPFLARTTFVGEYGDYNLRLKDETIDRYDIKHYKVGFRFPLTSSQGVDLGYEKVEYDPDLGDKATEEYINLGWGYAFNPNMSFKVLYQIIQFSQGGLIAPLQDYDGSVLATQFTVRF